MKIIRAGLGEVAGVAELFDLYRQFYGQPPDLELARTFLTARIERQESVVFVALDDQGQTLGFTQLYPTFSSEAAAPLFILNDLFVRSSLRQQGTGTALLNTAKKFAQGEGASGLCLATAITNQTARRLYVANGWVEETGFLTFLFSLPQRIGAP